MEGAIVVFYLFKTFTHLCAEDYTLGSIVFPALGWYGMFKIGTIVVTFLSV